MSERRCRSGPPVLIALSPGRADGQGLDELERRVHDAVRAGLPGLLLREPGLEDAPFLRLAQGIRARWPELWLGLHDRPHLASASDADAVHLGHRSLPPDLIRPWLAAPVALGLSTHAFDDAQARARWADADYLFHGPVHATHKDDPAAQGQPIGLAGLRAAVAGSAAPIWALGGMRPDNARAALEAGAAGVAVLGGLLAAENPAGRTVAYLEALAPAD